MNNQPFIAAAAKLDEAQLDTHSEEVKYEFNHAEGQDFHYPEALRQMPDAPDVSAIKRGMELEGEDMTLPLLQAAMRDWRLLACCAPYLLLATAAGFDQGAMNISGSMPSFLLDPAFGYFDIVNKTLAVESLWISLWPSLLFVGYMVGSSSCSYLLDRFGPRKIAIVFAIYMVGPILVQAFATSKGMLAAGKFLAGIAIGVFQTTAGNFTAEACGSSPKLRSIMTSGVGMALILGLVFGIATGAAVITDLREWHAWRLVLVLQQIIPTVALVLLPFSVTSPVFLIKKGRIAEAIKCTRKLTGATEDIVLARVASMQYAVAMEIEERVSHGKASVADAFKDPIQRRRTLLAIGVFVASQAGGTGFLGQGLYFLVQQGIDITLATNITLGCLTISAVVYPLASLISNRYGRRFTFVYLSILHLAVMVAIGFLGFNKGNTQAGWALAVLVNVGVSTQALSMASGCYTLAAEIPSLRLRATTLAIALTVNNFISLATTLVVPYIFQSPGYLGAKTALIFCGTLVAAIIWAFFYVPETNKRSAAEIDIMFASGLPARKFRSADVASLVPQLQEKVQSRV